MKWIKEYFIRKRLDKPQNHASKKNAWISEKIHKIGVIAQSLKELEALKEVIMIEFGDDIDLYGLYYDEKSEEKEAFSFKDFSTFGNPKEKINDFLFSEPDLVITASEKLNVFSLYLLHLKPELTSIGFYEENHKKYLDLMLSKEDTDLKANIHQLIKYLKQINKNEKV